LFLWMLYLDSFPVQYSNHISLVIEKQNWEKILASGKSEGSAVSCS
jgi:hypothetical protein